MAAAKPWRMTKERILEIARRKGAFRTSMRWRDEPVDRKCRELVKEGKLALSEKWHKFDNREYVLVTKR